MIVIMDQGGLEVRELTFKTDATPVSDQWRAGLTALLMRHVPILRYAKVNVLTGEVQEHDFAVEVLPTLDARLQGLVLPILESPGEFPAVAGPWCVGCPYMAGCPAVATVASACLLLDVEDRDG